MLKVKFLNNIHFYILPLIFFLWIYFYIFANIWEESGIAQAKLSSLKSSKYYVQTSQCQIPNVNPFTKPILETFRPLKYTNCTRNLPLYTSTYNEKLKTHILQLNKDIAIKYFPIIAQTKPKDLQCQYCQINRKRKKDSYKLTKYKTLPERFVVPRKIDAMIVQCKLISTKKNVYSDLFTFVHYKYTRVKKKPGVLLIGIDSLSRINLRRVMPKTYAYLKSTWFELQGYNKVADNTFPNLMPILNGYNRSATLAKCQPTILGGMDSEDCNIIWNTFKQFGYRTAYGEDAPLISTFNYKKSGFKDQPTDYYSRPWMKAMIKHLNIQKRHGRPFCIGYRHAGEYIFDYAHQLAKVYEGKSIFGLFWTNTFSHDSYDDPSMIDDQMEKYFKSFEREGILNSAIVIFFSDHGNRWGKLLNLPEGYFEERLPTFFISLPKSFEQKHPDFVKALHVNRNRLTSPYDIHMTLIHILELYEPQLKLPHAHGCSKCQSIFRIIPENRTCLDAGITDHWCACSQYESVSTKNSTLKKITKEFIKKMNKYLYDLNLAPICFHLSLNKIKDIYLKIEKHSSEYKPTYRIKFDVSPSRDVFETTVIYDPISKNSYASVADISRSSAYKNKDCLDKITDRVAEKICVCTKIK